MVAASGVRFDGLDLLALFFLIAVFAVAFRYCWNLTRPDEDLEHVVLRERALAGLRDGGIVILPEPDYYDPAYDPDWEPTTHIVYPSPEPRPMFTVEKAPIPGGTVMQHPTPIRWTIAKNGVVIDDREMEVMTMPIGFFPTGTMHEMFGWPQYELFGEPVLGNTSWHVGKRPYDWKKNEPYPYDWAEAGV